MVFLVFPEKHPPAAVQMALRRVNVKTVRVNVNEHSSVVSWRRSWCMAAAAFVSSIARCHTMHFPAPPPSLPALVANTYHRALASGDLIFTASDSVNDIVSQDVTYRIRFCPALLNKPHPTQHETVKSKKPNPFLPPHPGLLIAAETLDSDSAAPDSKFNLVLNKYPIIPHHFILSTATFLPQNEPLRKEDLAAVWSCVQSWREMEGERLYGFFNSGYDSGASQPHRHLQFIPVPTERKLFADDAPEDNEDKVWTHPAVPFTQFIVRLPKHGLVPERLYEIYNTLLQQCRAALDTDKPVSEWSYNMGITDSWIVLAPRTSESGGREGLSINGTVLAGEMLVKREEDLEFYKNGGIAKVLPRIGVAANGGQGRL